MTLQSNPLLTKELKSLNLNFQDLKPSHFSEAFEYLLPLAEKEHLDSISCEPTYENLFLKSENSEQLNIAYHLLHSLVSLDSSDELRQVQENYSNKIISFYMKTSLDVNSYNQIMKLKNSANFNNLTEGQIKTVNEVIKSFNQSGVHLPQEQKNELTQLNIELDNLRQQFEQNLTNYIEFSGFHVKLEDLDGLPERSILSAKTEKDGKTVYFVDENSGLFDDIMTFAKSSELRKKVYEVKKLSGRHPQFNNIDIISHIHLKKQKTAEILGYSSYSELSLEDNIAKNPLNVSKFLNELGQKALPKAHADFHLIHDFGTKFLQKSQLDPWDYSYVQNKYKELHLFINEEQIRNYFPVKHVVSKTFEYFSKLFNIEIRETEHLPLWNNDVKYYEIFENNNKISSFFFDPYARNGKMPGAWADGIIVRDFEIQQRLPVAMIVCNNPKDNNTESTFKFYELVTFFHEFGHLLHHCLSKVNYSMFSCFNNVQRDAIEFPSQFLENFVYQYEVIEYISSHIETKEPLHPNDFKKLYDLKLFMSGLFLTRFVQMSEMDLILYSQTEKDPISIEKESLKKWQVNPNSDLDNLRMPQFSHIFGGGYESNYYSYQWAEILSLDLLDEFSRNFHNSEKIQSLAQSYKENVLYTGGYNDMEFNFYQILGRKPNMDKYLKYYGIIS